MGIYILSRKEQRKLLNRILDNSDKANERLVNRLNLNDPRLVEHYLASELDVCLQFSCFGDGEQFGLVNTEDYIARFENIKPPFGNFGGELKFALRGQGDGGLPNGGLSKKPINTSRRDDGQTMFVFERELVNLPQFPSFASLVTLQPLDSFKHNNSSLLYFSLFEYRFKSLGGLPDWKVQIATDALKGRKTKPHELAEKMVERGAKIVDDISNNNRKFRRWVGNTLYQYLNNAGLVVDLMSETIRLRVNKPLASSFKIADVLFGPFNFRPDTSESRVRRYHNVMLSDKPTKQKTDKGFEIPVP